jgi:hypothetical protein
MFSNLFPTAEKFLAQPFRSDMNAGYWAALVVFVATVCVLWLHVLRHITEV